MGIREPFPSNAGSDTGYAMRLFVRPDWLSLCSCVLVLGIGAGALPGFGVLHASDSRQAEDSQSAVEKLLKEGLELTLTESGPDQPWRVQITNTTNRYLSVGTDPRLLWFTARVPGRKQQRDCKIPSDMSPKSVGKQSTLLAPREHFEFSVDPRFYCFDKGDQSVLVPGAQLVPHFGFEERTKKIWRRGKRVTIRQTQREPFIARLGAAPGPRPSASEESSGATEGSPPGKTSPMTEVETTSGLKEIVGPTIALNSSYIDWARVRLKQDGSEGPKLSLAVTRGSDSRTGRGARVTIKVTNNGDKTQRLFIRREHLSFLLLGPDGVMECPAANEERAPDAAAFTRLKPGRSTTLVTRLLEFCPAEYLKRAGFYLLAAELNATDDGSAVGINAFAGKLFSTRLRPLRIRSGELPFRHKPHPSLQQVRQVLADRDRARRAQSTPQDTSGADRSAADTASSDDAEDTRNKTPTPPSPSSGAAEPDAN